ncbi:MAG: hypothetical protein A2934_04140 [Candidatus Sungbacteria bacterium RIFCSPLOWO2_01_FULL_47_10]|uniref:Uncharacterized protein n=1 Tax=Candidatus Sungbacteria bacterium RIFCSPLOWO2_01_FULL_47_10 TaxID=1802276 RepID=A0A1G2L3R4_9BACT|nr:MAG: hypothetical protein A2934_04140 [Candidatus Sungbacteria bacterium RIFCSPLOWO2_01_FULL_47_10]
MESLEKKFIHTMMRGPEETDAEVLAEYLVGELKAPAGDLLEKMREKINALEYDSVLGDDTKSRIHSIVLSQALKEIYGSQKNLETRFVQGGTLLKTSPGHRNEVKKYLAKITPNLGKKTLIITEEIYSGESVSRLLEILKSLGIQADVAAFSMVDLDDGVVEKEVREKFLKQGVDLFIPDKSSTFMLPEQFGLLSRGRSKRGYAVKDMEPSHRPFIQFAHTAAFALSHKLAGEYMKKDRKNNLEKPEA